MSDYSMGSRFLAWFLDGLVIGVLSGILSSMGLGGGSFLVGSLVGSVGSALIYYLAFAYFNEGKTVGKIVFKMKITDDSGNPLEQKELMIREGCKALLSPLAFISFIIAVISDEKKSIHDMIAKSIVVKEVE